MSGKNKGFAKLNREHIEMEAFHGSESDDEFGLHISSGQGPAGACSCCGSSRWNVFLSVILFLTVAIFSLLFLYLAYQNQQMAVQLSDLETKVNHLTPNKDQSKVSVSDLSKRVDNVVSRLNHTLQSLLLTMHQVKTDCHNIVINGTAYNAEKTQRLDAQLNQVIGVQSEVQKAAQSLASMKGTLDRYDQEHNDLTKSLGDVRLVANEAHKAIEHFNFTRHEVLLQNLSLTVHRHVMEFSNDSNSCCHDIQRLEQAMSVMNLTMEQSGSHDPPNITEIMSSATKLLNDPSFLTNYSMMIIHVLENINTTVLLDSMMSVMPALLNATKSLDLGMNASDFNPVGGIGEKNLGTELHRLNNSLQALAATVATLVHRMDSYESSSVVPTKLPLPSPTTASYIHPLSTSVTVNVIPNNATAVSSSEQISNATENPANGINKTSSASGDQLPINTSTTDDVMMTSSDVVMAISSSVTVTSYLPNENSSSVAPQATGVPSVTNAPVTSSSPDVVTSPVASSLPVVVSENRTGRIIAGLQKLLGIFDSLDKDADNKLTMNETGFSLQHSFDLLDADSDSYITADEIKQKITELELKLTNTGPPSGTTSADVAVPPAPSIPSSSPAPSIPSASVIPIISSTVYTATDPQSIVASSTPVPSPSDSLMDDLDAKLELELSDYE